MKEIEIYTDGACSGNPGPGGWGALLRYQGAEKKWIERELKGAEKLTTNNRMELMGAIEGLKALKEPCKIRLFTDSVYVQKGITEWITGWKKKGWKNSKKEDVKNADLWKILEEETLRHEIQWIWVKGHSGHPENDRVDALARLAIDEMR
jgi:ribonuclease HI